MDLTSALCGRRQESIAEMASIREELFTSERRLQEKDAEVAGAQKRCDTAEGLRLEEMATRIAAEAAVEKLQAGDGSGLGTAAG